MGGTGATEFRNISKVDQVVYDAGMVPHTVIPGESTTQRACKCIPGFVVVGSKEDEAYLRMKEMLAVKKIGTEDTTGVVSTSGTKQSAKEVAAAIIAKPAPLKEEKPPVKEEAAAPEAEPVIADPVAASVALAANNPVPADVPPPQPEVSADTAKDATDAADAVETNNKPVRKGVRSPLRRRK